MYANLCAAALCVGSSTGSTHVDSTQMQFLFMCVGSSTGSTYVEFYTNAVLIYICRLQYRFYVRRILHKFSTMYANFYAAALCVGSSTGSTHVEFYTNAVLIYICRLQYRFYVCRILHKCSSYLYM